MRRSSEPKNVSAIEARANSLHPEQLLEMARRARLVQCVTGHQPMRERLHWSEDGSRITITSEPEEDEADEWPSKGPIGPPVAVKVVTKPDGRVGTSPKVPPGKGANLDRDEDEGVEEKPLRPVIPMTLSQPIAGCQVAANSLPPEVRETLAASAGVVRQTVERYRSRQRVTETVPRPRSLASRRLSTLSFAESAIHRLNQLNRDRQELSQAERARLAWLETFPATVSRYALRP